MPSTFKPILDWPVPGTVGGRPSVEDNSVCTVNQPSRGRAPVKEIRDFPISQNDNELYLGPCYY